MRRDCTLELLGPCNYRCWYCVGDTPGPRFEQPVLHDLGRLRNILSIIKGDEVHTKILARGSEPCLHPQITEIVQPLTPLGTVEIYTNLSRPVAEWLPGCHNIFLVVTLHPEAKKNTLAFMERVRDAVNQGYRIRVQILTQESKTDRSWQEWQDMIHAIGGTSTFEVHPINVASTLLAESKRIPIPEAGVLCSGGYSSFRVAYNDPSRPVSGSTTLYRCDVTSLNITQLFSKPKPCPHPCADRRCYAGIGREVPC